MKIVDIKQRTPEWHRWRNTGVSASEAAILMKRSNQWGQTRLTIEVVPKPMKTNGVNENQWGHENQWCHENQCENHENHENQRKPKPMGSDSIDD